MHPSRPIWQLAWDAGKVCTALRLDITAQPEHAMRLLSQACIQLINHQHDTLSGFQLHACRRATASKSSSILDVSLSRRDLTVCK